MKREKWLKSGISRNGLDVHCDRSCEELDGVSTICERVVVWGCDDLQ